MNKSKKLLNLTKRDGVLIFGFGALAAILNVYPFPYVAAGVAVLAILLVRISESTDEPADTPAQDERTIEKRSAEEIIMSKLNGGAIEQAIDERFDKMVQDVVDDLFGSYGGISRQIKDKLKESMNPYIEQHDFSEHAVKMEHLLNNIIREVTSEQDVLMKNVQDMLGTAPIKEIEMSKLFEKFTEYISETIETSDLDIDYDDEPSYKPLTVELSSTDEPSMGSMEKKSLRLSCEEDSDFDIEIVIERWPDLSDKSWHISRVERVGGNEPTFRQKLHGNKDLTTMETPMANLRELNEFEIYLLKLYYDRADIILNATELLDDEVEVDAEPEVSYS